MSQRTGVSELERVETLISEECDAIKTLLKAKNKKYGNSAFNPVRIFSKSSTEEQICVRIDDKLSRIAQGHGFDSPTGSPTDENTVDDLIGYLILLKIKRRLDPIGVPPSR